MTAHDWYVENRTAFVTKVLDPAEEATYTSHLARCDECRAAVAQLERDLAWLPMGAAPISPRPGLAQSIMDNVLRPERSHRWQWTAALATAASLMLALGGWAQARHENVHLRRILEARQGRLAAIEDSLSAIVGAERVLQEPISTPGYRGGVLIFYDQDTERWNVVVHDIPEARTGEVYQLWFVTDRGLRPGPMLEVHGSRPTFVTLPAPSSDVLGAALTVEPAGGSADGPRGIELARLTF